jgi:uncharacterized membrane protein YidH (DUF202 family)
MTRILLDGLRRSAVVAFALVLAHQAVFLVRYGSIYGEALAHTGHGQAWSDAVTIVIAGAAVLFGAAIVGLHRLARRLDAGTRPGSARMSLRRIAIRWLRTSIGLTVAVVVLLTVQENLEHAATGFGMPGPGILVDPGYPFAVAIVALVATSIALVVSLFSWRREVLVARLRAQARNVRRVPIAPTRPTAAAPVPSRTSTLARRLGRRAPPALRLA